MAVALGKFDALHRGHRALALAASEAGAPVVLSFSGMAEVLGWAPRLPVVAPSDRARVLALWSASAPTSPPLVPATLPFSSIRQLSPAAFVALLKSLGAATVVAGRNYRFGFRASGDASALATLCGEHAMRVSIVEMVCHDGKEVSSSSIRASLAEGDVRTVALLLGRPHRLVLQRGGGGGASHAWVPLNQPPKEGKYDAELVGGQSGQTERIRVTVTPSGELLLPEAALASRNGSQQVEIEF